MNGHSSGTPQRAPDPLRVSRYLVEDSMKTNDAPAPNTTHNSAIDAASLAMGGFSAGAVWAADTISLPPLP